MLWGRAMLLAASAACGRLNFDPLGSDCVLALEPATSDVNLNSRLQLTAPDARAPIAWRIASGQGSVDASGMFFAGDRVETVVIEATDADGCIGTATITVGGSSLFYISGEDGNTIPQAGVWSSTTGASWQMIGALPAARVLGRSLVFDDRMWFLGGSSATDVWSSTDGSMWRPESPLPGPLNEYGVAAYRGRMWLVGGSNGATNTDAVFASGDGITWQLVGHLPVALHGTRCSQYRERLWCVGGHSSAGRFDRVFSSGDGVAWVDEAPLPFTREEQGQIVLADDTLVVIGGSDFAVGPQQDGAITRDGVTWTVSPALPETRYITDLAQIGGTIYLVGAQVAVLASSDGVTWTQVGALPLYRDGGGFVAFTPH